MFSFCECALDLRWFAAQVHTFSTGHSSICLVTLRLAQLETVKTLQDSPVTQRGGGKGLRGISWATLCKLPPFCTQCHKADFDPCKRTAGHTPHPDLSKDTPCGD
ncbi:mCG1048778 [Mus musculus]|nr:mCG1048778 [Mus musculus]